RMTTITAGTMPVSCGDTNIGNVMDRGYNFNDGAGDNGNVMAMINYRDASRSQSFTYDALNRITAGWSSANTGNYSWGENYSIDAWGNLQVSPIGGKAHGGTFQLSGNAQNRPTGLAYDAAGNLMSYLSSTYTYDQENRLASTAGMSYTYDGNGERVLKFNTSTGAAVKRYWSMGGNTLGEGDGSGNLTAEYVFFGGKRVARIDLPANTVHYYLSDHLGSTSIIVTATGIIEEESDYYPFGTEVVVSGGINELKFTGKRRDTESQLDYFGARYYTNVMARFTSPDPGRIAVRHLLNPQKLNKYAYVLNNPLTLIDPDGLEEIKVFVAFAAGQTMPQNQPNWGAIQKTAAEHGNNVTVFQGDAANSKNFQSSLSSGGTTVFIGHSQIVDNGKGMQTAGISLADKEIGRPSSSSDSNGAGRVVFNNNVIGDPGKMVPGELPNVSASSNVALFGCATDQLSSQYAGAASFVGVDSGADHATSTDGLLS